MGNKVPYEGARELRWVRVSSCLLTYVDTEVELADGLWNDWLAAVADERVKGVLICAAGPIQPSHQQWRRATRTMRDRDIPASVVTESRHNLALAKAASWLGTDMLSFEWSEVKMACQRICDDEKLIPALRMKLVTIRDAHGPVSVTGDRKAPEFERSRYNSMFSPTSHIEVSSEEVLETNSEIQATLAALQARSAKRTGQAG